MRITAGALIKCAVLLDGEDKELSPLVLKGFQEELNR